MIKIEAKFKRGLPPKGDPEKYLTIGAGICLRIMHEMINKGKDIFEKSFEKYSPGYFAWKKKRGRNPESAGDWLRYTGQMLGSHGLVYVDEQKFILGFSGTRHGSASNAIIAYANNMIRRFVGLSKKNKERAKLELTKELKSR